MQLICIGAVAIAHLYMWAKEMADVNVSLAIKKATKNQHIHSHSMSGVMLCTIMFIYVFWLTVQLSTMATPVKLRLKKREQQQKETTTTTMLVILCAILFG